MNEAKFYFKPFGKSEKEITKDEFIKENERFYKVGRLDRAIKRMKQTLRFNHPNGFYKVQA